MTYLFAFDAFAFSPFLEYFLGDVEILGLASAPNKEVVFKRNYDKGYAKADLESSKSDKVYGTLYGLNDMQLEILRNKLLISFRLELLELNLHWRKRIKAYTLIPANTIESIIMPPTKLYIDFMLAGLTSVSAPKAYLKKLEEVNVDSTRENSSLSWFRPILKYPGTTKKYFDSAKLLIENITSGGEFTTKAETKLFNKRNLTLSKELVGFSFKTTVKIKKGIQDDQELIEDTPNLVLSKKYFVSGKGFVISNIKYGDSEKCLTGSIHAIESVNLNRENYWRLVLPVNTLLDFTRDFQYTSILQNGRLRQALVLNILGVEIHFYASEIKENKYVVIDALSRLPLKRFQEYAHSILLVYAILKGNYYSGDSFFLAYQDVEMKLASGIAYHQLSDGINELPGLFTTNPYTGINKLKYRRNNKGLIPQKLIKSIHKGITRFSVAHYSSLCALMLSKEKILRAIIQIVHNQYATLEIKIPVMYVALETITAEFVKGGNKELKPIEDDKLNDQLIKELKSSVDRFTNKNNFSAEQLERIKPLIKKLNTLNSPPNADKLSKVFPTLGYIPTNEDIVVIKERNSFLHGSTLKISLTDEDYGFKKLYDLSLRLNFLLAVLLLKKVGFSGKLINYNKLHEHITQIYRDEDVLVMI